MNQAARMALGWIGSDIWDGVTDVVTSVWDRVPGSELVESFVEGPVRDFASTAVGKVVLRAISTSLTGGLAPTLGPQLATVAWTLPGVLRGEDWDEAWLAEFNYRAEATAEVFGAEVGTLLGQQLGRALEYIRERVPEGAIVNWAAEELARALDIRVDVAAAAIDLVNRGFREMTRGGWDPETGRRILFPAERMGPSLSEIAILRQTSAAAATPEARGLPIVWDMIRAGALPEVRAVAPAPAPSVAPAIVERGAPPAPSSSAAVIVLGLVALAAAGGGAYYFTRRRRR